MESATHAFAFYSLLPTPYSLFFAYKKAHTIV